MNLKFMDIKVKIWSLTLDQNEVMDKNVIYGRFH